MPPRHEEPGETPGSGPKLVIGYSYADNGARPLPSGTVFWASPFISVSTADPVTGFVPPDVPATVSVQIQNLSPIGAALGTKATFFVATPSAGALTGITKIGESASMSLIAGAADIFECTTSWEPSLAEGTHQCLLVHAECLNDTVQVPARADLDRHVAQRNLTIAAGPEQQMTLTIANPFVDDSLATIAVHTWRVRGLEPEMAERLGGTRWDVLAHAGTAAVRELLADIGAEVEITDPVGIGFQGVGDESPFEPFDEETQRQLRDRRGEGLGGNIVAEANLAAASQRQVLLVANPPQEGDDSVFVHHLVQRIDGIEIGGYTVVSAAGRPF